MICSSFMHVLTCAVEDSVLCSFTSRCANFQTSVPALCLLSCVSSGCEIRGSYGPGAHLTVRPQDRPQDDDARGGSCRPWEATAARAASHPTAATDPEAAPNSRVSEAARESDTAAPGAASGAHQGSKCIFVSDLLSQGACTTMRAGGQPMRALMGWWLRHGCVAWRKLWLY